MVVIEGQKPMYSGVLDCFWKTIKAEGPLGLYKGIAAPLAGTVPMYALCFTGYDFGKRIFCDEQAYTELKVGQIAMAGATSALFTTPIMAPQERLKCVMQTQGIAEGSKVVYNSSWECAKGLLAEGGIMNLTRGLEVTVMRDAAASMAYFAVYEVLKAKIAEATGAERNNISFGGVIIAGGTAGVLNWVLALPFDVLKTRYQTAAMGQYTGAFVGSKSVFKELMAKDGISGLYRGAAPTFLRAFPANAACFLGYEVSLKALTSAGL
jgi:solute carrier family 25 carnitine/acylcarnitine transporter 20/29